MKPSICLLAIGMLCIAVLSAAADESDKELIEAKTGKYMFVPHYSTGKNAKRMLRKPHFAGYRYPKKGYRHGWGMPAVLPHMKGVQFEFVDQESQDTGAGMQPRVGNAMYEDDFSSFDTGNGEMSDYSDSGFNRRRRRYRRRRY